MQESRSDQEGSDQWVASSGGGGGWVYLEGWTRGLLRGGVWGLEEEQGQGQLRGPRASE